MTGRRKGPELAVLGYHKIGPPPPGGWDSWYYIPEDVFRSQLHFLRATGWTVIDAPTLVAGLDDPDILPERAALITFDDGYLSNLAVAAPVLQEFEYPGIVFVPTSFIGGVNDFDCGVEPEERICSWADLERIEGLGVSVQSHGVSHRAFSTLCEAQINQELRDSRSALESRLRHRVDLFSFPFGDAGEEPGATETLLANAGYRGAFLYGQGSGTNRRSRLDRFALPRVAMGPDTDLAKALTDNGQTRPVAPG